MLTRHCRRIERRDKWLVDLQRDTHSCLSAAAAAAVTTGGSAVAGRLSRFQQSRNAQRSKVSSFLFSQNFQQGSRRGCSATAAASDGDPVSEQQLPPGVFQQHCKVAGKLWTFETGRLAKLAHGSCVVSVGGTSVLATAVVDPTPQLEADGVPLQV